MKKSYSSIAVCILSALSVPARAPAAESSVHERFAQMEKSGGGKLGVSALDVRTGKRLSLHGDKPFLLCSTFKFLLAAAILKQSDEGKIDLCESIPYTAKELIAYSPITRKHLSKGSMSTESLCAAAVEHSDNAAANLLMKKLGGLKAFNAFVKSLGDEQTHLDRLEPFLNSAKPGELKDITTPDAIVADLQKLFGSDVLSSGSRAFLKNWMVHCATGDHRLRAGFPSTWVVADKTGTGEANALNDVAVAWTSGAGQNAPTNTGKNAANDAAPQIIVAVYTDSAKISAGEQEKMIADVAKLIAHELEP